MDGPSTITYTIIQLHLIILSYKDLKLDPKILLAKSISNNKWIIVNFNFNVPGLHCRFFYKLPLFNFTAENFRDFFALRKIFMLWLCWKNNFEFAFYLRLKNKIVTDLNIDLNVFTFFC